MFRRQPDIDKLIADVVDVFFCRSCRLTYSDLSYAVTGVLNQEEQARLVDEVRLFLLAHVSYAVRHSASSSKRNRKRIDDGLMLRWLGLFDNPDIETKRLHDRVNLYGSLLHDERCTGFSTGLDSLKSARLDALVSCLELNGKVTTMTIRLHLCKTSIELLVETARAMALMPS